MRSNVSINTSRNVNIHALKNINMHDLYHEAYKYKLKNSLSFFCQEAFKHVDPAKYVHNWHIDLICEELEAFNRGEFLRLIINIPPGCMKSLIASVFFPAWQWLSMPNTSTLSISHTSKLALRDANKMRNLIKSKWYQDLIKINFNKDQDAKGLFINNSFGGRLALGMHTNNTGWRADQIILDDPQAARAALSNNKRQAVIEAFDFEICNRLNDLQTGKILLIQQRLHPEDLTGHLLEQNKYLPAKYKWRVLCLPAIYDDAIPNLCPKDQRKNGDLIFTEKFTLENYQQEKISKGSWMFNTQYQQMPTDLEGAIFKEKWISNVLKCNHLICDFDRIIQVWDTSFTGKTTSDYCACVILGGIGDEYWLLDLHKSKMDFVQTIHFIKEYSNKHYYTKNNICVEEKANGAAILSAFKQNLSGYNIKGITVSAKDGSKTERALSITAILENGHFYISDAIEQDKINTFIKDLIQFKEGSGNDDLVDAFVLALREFQKNNTHYFFSSK